MAGIDETADEFYLYCHLVTILEIYRRLPECTDAMRGACQDDIAREKGKMARQEADDEWKLEYHPAGAAVLHQLSIQDTSNP